MIFVIKNKIKALVKIFFFLLIFIVKIGYSQDTISGKIYVLDTTFQMMNLVDSIKCPSNINESNIFLDSIIHESKKQYIKTQTENDFISTYFYIIEIRWNKYFSCVSDNLFKKYDFGSPRDVMELILKCYYRHLKGLNLNIESELKYYQTKNNDMFYVSNKEYKKRVNRIKNGKFKPIDAIRHIDKLNDSIQIITITINTGDIIGLTRYLEYLPCNSKITIINKGKCTWLAETDYTLKFMWSILPNLDIIKLQYKLNYKIEKKELKKMYGELQFVKDNYRLLIEVKNEND